MAKKTLRTTAKRRPAWLWVAVVASGLLVVVIALAVSSHFLWQRHAEAVEQQTGELRTLTAQTFSDTELSTDKLETYASVLKEKSDLCEHGLLEGYYQKAVSSAADTHNSCLEYADRVKSVADMAEKVNARLSDDRALSGILRSAQVELKELKPEQYKESRAVWQKASEAVGELEVSNDYQQTREDVKKSIDGITKSFTAVEKANTAKKRTDFDNAVADLGNAYNKLAKINANDRQLLESLVRQARDL